MQRVIFMGLFIENGTYHKSPKFLKEFLNMDRPANLGIVQKTLNSLAFMKDHISHFASLHHELSVFIKSNLPSEKSNPNRIPVSVTIWG